MNLQQPIATRLKRGFNHQNTNETVPSKQPVLPVVSKMGEYISCSYRGNLILARAQFELSVPYENSPKTGKFAIFFQVSQLSNALLQVWKPRTSDKTLGRILARGLRQCLNLENLIFSDDLVGSLVLDMQVYKRGADSLDIAYLLGHLAIEKCLLDFNALDYSNFFESQDDFEKFKKTMLKYQIIRSHMTTAYKLGKKVCIKPTITETASVSDPFSFTFDEHGFLISAVKHYQGHGLTVSQVKQMYELCQSNASESMHLLNHMRQQLQ